MLMRRAGAKRSLEPSSFTNASQCSLAKAGRAVPSASEAPLVRRAVRSRTNSSAVSALMVTWRSKARFVTFAPEGVRPGDWPNADWADPMVTIWAEPMLANWAEPVNADWEDAIAGGKGANAKERESRATQKTNGSLMQRAGQLSFGHGWQVGSKKMQTNCQRLSAKGRCTGHRPRPHS